MQKTFYSVSPQGQTCKNCMVAQRTDQLARARHSTVSPIGLAGDKGCARISRVAGCITDAAGECAAVAVKSTVGGRLWVACAHCKQQHRCSTWTTRACCSEVKLGGRTDVVLACHRDILSLSGSLPFAVHTRVTPRNPPMSSHAPVTAP
jgi:hypothetical protein